MQTYPAGPAALYHAFFQPLFSGSQMKRLALAIMLVLRGPRAADADAETCREAMEAYQSVLEEVSDALTDYATCISNSQGGVDCSNEFAALQSAQTEFELAVTNYQNECR